MYLVVDAVLLAVGMKSHNMNIHSGSVSPVINMSVQGSKCSSNRRGSPNFLL